MFLTAVMHLQNGYAMPEPARSHQAKVDSTTAFDTASWVIYKVCAHALQLFAFFCQSSCKGPRVQLAVVGEA